MGKQDRRWLGSSDPHARLRRIEALDPRTDYLEISSLFYGDFRSLMISLPLSGFLTTFAAPRMSRILSSTGELEHRFAKRAIDTSLFAKAIHTHGFGSGPGRDAARKVNALHARYDIHPDDFVLVGCDPAVYSIDLAETYGWRPVTDAEKAAVRLFYNNQARAFGSKQNIPETIDGMRALVSDYFDTQLHFEPQNRTMATTAIDWYSSLAPAPLRPLMRRIFPALMDRRVIAACGLPPASRSDRVMAGMLMRHLARRDPVPDGAPDMLEALVKRVYPDGWTLDALGPREQPIAAE